MDEKFEIGDLVFAPLMSCPSDSEQVFLVVDKDPSDEKIVRIKAVSINDHLVKPFSCHVSRLKPLPALKRQIMMSVVEYEISCRTKKLEMLRNGRANGLV